MSKFNFCKKLYRVSLYDDLGFVQAYSLNSREQLKKEVHAHLSNGFSVIVRFIGPISVHLKTFNQYVYVHGDSKATKR